jgi:putative GTP pyrophosphokinase
MEQESSGTSFDFASYEREAVSAYLPKQRFYENLANTVAMVLEACLKKRGIKVHSVQHRAKEPASFGRKAAIPSESDPNSPKYPDPMKDITDLAGVRVIAHFPGTLADIDQILCEEFDVTERSDKGKELVEEERFGYQSVHYLVRVKPDRTRLAEYYDFSGAVAEVQVRTILQHAWAEIEHDIQYKSSRAIPSEIRRRFMALAGMLEIADREFQAIQDTDKQLEERAKAVVVEGGNLSGVEITPNALKSLLDKRLGPDDRISDWAYDWTTRLLKQLGFRDLKQVETAIAPFNDDQLSRLAMFTRQGQTTRFELMLLAALGERFLERHPHKGETGFDGRFRHYLERFRQAGIQISNYDPETTTTSPSG